MPAYWGIAIVLPFFTSVCLAVYIAVFYIGSCAAYTRTEPILAMNCRQRKEVSLNDRSVDSN